MAKGRRAGRSTTAAISASTPRPLEADDPGNLGENDGGHDEPRLDEPGGDGEEQPAGDSYPPGEPATVEGVGELAQPVTRGTPGRRPHEALAEPPRAFLPGSGRPDHERLSARDAGAFESLADRDEDGIGVPAEFECGRRVGDRSLRVAPLEPQEAVPRDVLDPHDRRVLQREERAIVVPTARGPSDYLGEREWAANPLALPGRIAELPRRQDSAVRDERVIAAPSHDDLARFEPGFEEGVAFGEPSLAALDRFASQPPLLRP